jgi:hypothetical protein
MNKENEKIAVQMLDEIDRARSGSLGLEELEYRLWRLLEATDETFPRIVAGQVEDLVLEIRQLQKSNTSGPGGSEADENRGIDDIYNAITGAIGAAIR